MTFGEQITLDELERDPYPTYARVREEEPVAWVPAVQLWLVTRYDDVRTVDLSPELFTAATDPSTLNRTMGIKCTQDLRLARSGTPSGGRSISGSTWSPTASSGAGCS